MGREGERGRKSQGKVGKRDRERGFDYHLLAKVHRIKTGFST